MEVNTMLIANTKEQEKLMYKEYELELSKEKYFICLYISNQNELFLHAKNKSSINMIYYKKKYSFEQLKALTILILFE